MDFGPGSRRRLSAALVEGLLYCNILLCNCVNKPLNVNGLSLWLVREIENRRRRSRSEPVLPPSRVRYTCVTIHLILFMFNIF